MVIRTQQRQALPHLLACLAVRSKSTFVMKCIITELVQEDKGLLNHKARPHGNSALHNFAANGSVEFVELMLKSDADFKLKNDAGNTPLHAACEMTRPNLEVLQLFIAAGSDTAELNNSKDTPLLLLCKSLLPNYKESEHRSIFKFVISTCSKEVLDLADASGLTALARAVQFRNNNIITDFLEAGCSPLSLSIASVCLSSLALEAVILALLERFEPEPLRRMLNECDTETGHSPLVLAAKYNNIQCFQMLLDAGADPNMPDRNGKCPIDFLRNPIHRDGKAIKALLEKHNQGQ